MARVLVVYCSPAGSTAHASRGSTLAAISLPANRECRKRGRNVGTMAVNLNG